MINTNTGITMITLIILLATACSPEVTPPCEIPEPTLSEKDVLLNAAKDQITIDETTLKLDSWVKIDPLFGVDNAFTFTSLIDIDSINISDNIILSEQYVIKGDSIWFASFTNERRETEPYIIYRIARNGPKWNEHDEVSVIARIINSTNCSEFYLIYNTAVQCDC